MNDNSESTIGGRGTKLALEETPPPPFSSRVNVDLFRISEDGSSIHLHQVTKCARRSHQLRCTLACGPDLESMDKLVLSRAVRT